MAKGKLNLPDTPEYFQDPRFTQGLDTLFGAGETLMGLDFSDQFQPLQDVISFNPEITDLALKTIQAQMAPQIRDQQQSIINQLAANNQLESSVTADALSRFNTDIASQMQSFVYQAGMQDINRALQGRQDLFGLGLNATGQATGMSFQDQSARNNFNMQNYENQVGAAIANQKNQGGLMGALSGAGGGALAGMALAIPTSGLSLGMGALYGGLAGGVMGGFGSSGTGSQILQSGAGLYGMSQNPWMNIGQNIQPGSTASNDMFGNSRSRVDDLVKQLELYNPNALFGGLS